MNDYSLFLSLALSAWLSGCGPVETTGCVTVPDLEVPTGVADSIADHLRWVNSIHEYFEDHIQQTLPADTVRRLRMVYERLPDEPSSMLTVYKARIRRLEAMHLQNRMLWDDSRDTLLASAARLTAMDELPPAGGYELSYHYNLLSIAGTEFYRPEEAIAFSDSSLAINLAYGFTAEAAKDYFNQATNYSIIGQIALQDSMLKRTRVSLGRSESCFRSANDTATLVGIDFLSARLNHRLARSLLYAGDTSAATKRADRAYRNISLADNNLRRYALEGEFIYRAALSEVAVSLAADFGFLQRPWPLAFEPTRDSLLLALPDGHPMWVYLHAIMVNGLLAKAIETGDCNGILEDSLHRRAAAYAKTTLPTDLPPSLGLHLSILNRRLAMLYNICDREPTAETQLAEASDRSIANYETFVLGLATEPQLEARAGDHYGVYADILHARNQEKDFDERLLQLSDRSKSLTLRLAFEKRKSAQEEGNENRDLLERERILAAGVRRALLDRGAEGIVSANRAYEAYLDSLAMSDDPSRRGLYLDVRSLEPISVADIQDRLLDTTRAAIDLFYGRGRILVSVVTHRGARQFQVPVDSSLLAALQYAYDLGASGPTALKHAHRLHHRLFSEPLAWLENQPEIRTLIVANDHRMPNIDLGLLPTQAPAEGTHWSRRHLLYDDYRLVYTYSLSSMLAKRQLASRRAPPPGRWGTFAALSAYSDDIPALNGLRAAIEDTHRRYLHDRVDSLYVEAEPGRVQKEAPGFRYLVLASHGFADELLPERYYLQFKPNQKRKGTLTTYDLYGTPLNADLTLALNCDSGRGEARNFEGEKSIARALLYAGSSAVIAGRGLLQDRAAAEILRDFTREWIQNGRTASAALHYAKMAYRERYPDQGPFGWGSLVYYGDPDIRFIPGEVPGDSLLR